MKKRYLSLFCIFLVLLMVSACGTSPSNSDKQSDSALSDTSNSEITLTRVGASEYGYWDIPKDGWVKYQDLSYAEDVLQYSDSSGKYITTSRFFEIDGLTELDVANYYYGEMENGGAADVTGAMEKLGDANVIKYTVIIPKKILCGLSGCLQWRMNLTAYIW